MYGYKDYFDTKKSNKGYASAGEELSDALALLDMLIEHYMDAKTSNSEGMIFSRGMKMTEREVESYFFTEPTKRVSIGYNEDFAKEVTQAFLHIEKRTAATPEELRLPIRDCKRILSLDDGEVLALILAISIQYDMKYARLYGYIANENSMQYPTVGVLLALMETFDMEGAKEAVAEVTDEEGIFYRLCLDKSSMTKESRPALHMPLVLHPLLYRYICFGPEKPEAPVDAPIPGSYADFMEKLVALEKASEGDFRYYIECMDDKDVKLLLNKLTDKALYIIELNDADPDHENFGFYVQKQVLSALLTDGRTAVSCKDINKLLACKKELAYLKGYYIFGCENMPDEFLHMDDDFMAAPIKLALPDAQERLFIWKKHVEGFGINLASDVSLEALSDTYDFSCSGIREIVKQTGLVMKTKKDEPVERAELLSVIFRFDHANFAGLATRVHTAYVWEDMEIAEAQKKRLLVACDRYRYRGRIDEKYGVAKKNAYGNGGSVLMYGAPGTGKTMAAQVVANELGLPLYRVDVSQIFSKYIGETEKNLGRIFEEAKKSNVILFFDEADALFAKRTDVGDSNDRYANAETAYLLQKIEEHNGMTILATNLYHNFDSAFVRRITYVVHIDSPDEDTRLRLWKHTLPESMPISSDVDFEFLAERFELSGSNIKAILHTAAYMAGAKDRPITMADVIISLRYELEKLGRIIDSTDFDNYGVYL